MIAATVLRARGVYPGWWLAVASCLSLGLVDGMAFWAFGLFSDPLQHEFGWTRADIAGGTSLSLLAGGCASPLVGRLIDRWGPRRVILIGTLGSAATYVLLGGVRELWQLLALLTGLGFFQSWILYVPFTTLVTRWFTRRRAFALGIVTSGFTAGGLLYLPLIIELLTALGWRATFALAGIAILLVNGAILVLVRDRPSGCWAEFDEGTGGALGGSDEGVWPAMQLTDILRFPPFWLTVGGFALYYFSSLAFLFHGPALFIEQGMLPRHAAVTFSSMAGFGVLLRLAAGGWIDRFERTEVLAAGVLFMMAAALGCLLAGLSVPLLTLFVMLWGIGAALGPPLEALIITRLFGRPNYGSLFGVMDGVIVVTSIPAAWLGGLLFDLTGSYTGLLRLYGGALLVGGICLVVVARHAAREARRTTGGADPEAPRQAELDGLLRVAQQLARTGDRDGAYDHLVRLLELNPMNQEAWLWRAATAERPDEAIGCLKRAFELDPTDERARRGLERMLRERTTEDRPIARERTPDPTPADWGTCDPGSFFAGFQRVSGGLDPSQVYAFYRRVAVLLEGSEYPNPVRPSARTSHLVETKSRSVGVRPSVRTVQRPWSAA